MQVWLVCVLLHAHNYDLLILDIFQEQNRKSKQAIHHLSQKKGTRPRVASDGPRVEADGPGDEVDGPGDEVNLSEVTADVKLMLPGKKTIVGQKGML